MPYFFLKPLEKWAKDYIGKAVSAGLIKGMDDGSFAPASNSTRAQAVSVISRLLS